MQIGSGPQQDQLDSVSRHIRSVLRSPHGPESGGWRRAGGVREACGRRAGNEEPFRHQRQHGLKPLRKLLHGKDHLVLI